MGEGEASAMEMGEGELVEMGEGEASAMEMGEGEWVRVNRVRNFGDGDEASEMRKQMEKQRRNRERRALTECVDEREVLGERHY